MGAGCAISGAGWILAATRPLDGLVKTRFGRIADRNDDLAWLAVANNSRRAGSVAGVCPDRFCAFGHFMPSKNRGFAGRGWPFCGFGIFARACNRCAASQWLGLAGLVR